MLVICYSLSWQVRHPDSKQNHPQKFIDVENNILICFFSWFIFFFPLIWFRFISFRCISLFCRELLVFIASIVCSIKRFFNMTASNWFLILKSIKLHYNNFSWDFARVDCAGAAVAAVFFSFQCRISICITIGFLWPSKQKFHPLLDLQLCFRFSEILFFLSLCVLVALQNKITIHHIKQFVLTMKT